MPGITRFGISLPGELLRKFDRFIREKGYTNRSQAIADLIRAELVRKDWQEGGEVAGAITLIFNHHKRARLNLVTDIQHDYQELIISTQHIHLDHDNCLEIIAVRCSAVQARELRDSLQAIKGIKHATLSMSSTGRELD